ncbi:U-box domain-containing protein 1-like [Asparagus officinalis]|uniref:U-box domain-containing protein 1-like n=1 Tax=Asparagus officinalis TaxID=4686 RepID=UPI00098E229A|nr:U-box domain-containing protein 1-like [Asparagus officinalis]
MAKERDNGESLIIVLDRKKLEEIMWRVGLRSASDYDEEQSRLSMELREQAGTGGLVAVSNVNNLISLLSYSKSLMFRDDQAQPRPPASLRRVLNRSSSWSVSSSPSFNSMVLNIPDEFRCPITLDLMKDPVIVASGHTYDRSSIGRWINSGHHTCPKSGQKLIHMALIPNYAIKSLISQWCKENNIPSTFWEAKENASNAHAVVDHISAVKAATEAVRMTAEFLVGKLAMGSPEIQRQAAYELRLLALRSLTLGIQLSRCA